MNVTAHARRSGGWWAVEVPELPGVFTQARRLDQVQDMVVDAVRTMREDETLTVTVDVVPHVTPDVDDLTADARRASAEAARAAESSRRSMQTAAAALRTAQLPVRDVAYLLGISHQRVSQILPTTNHTPEHA